MQKRRLVQRQSKRTVERLMRELRYFDWLQPRPISGEKLITTPHVITSEGQKALALSQKDARAFRRLLTVKMQRVYVIPGWFIARLWQINPTGQGEVILPTPLDGWRPSSKDWNDNTWDKTLHTQVLAVAQRARESSPDAFPIRDEAWLSTVRRAWDRLSALKPRSKRKRGSATYRPRARLALAMREAGVGLLFDRAPYGADEPDFSGDRPPIYPRTFMGWCPRLETLEMLFYTDWHPQVPGRLLFPTSVFRSSAPKERFEPLEDVQQPNGDLLWLHQPTWVAMQKLFLDTLISVYQYQATRSVSRYVSLLDVRDEVCRQLRLSSLCFDHFLEQAVRELPGSDFPWSVALETDVLEGQSSGAGQLRRPVYVEDVPHTLIALARLRR